MKHRNLVAVVACFGAMLAAAEAALADAIDGDWCSTSEVGTFSISGSIIVTPAGTQTTGDYSRHAFSYVVPAGDPGAGETIEMILLNEEEVRVSEGGRESRIWRRCEVIS